MAAEANLGSQIGSETEAYLDRIDRCVSLLPELLARYRAGEAYRETAATLRRLESECDRCERRIAALVTNATAADLGLWNSRLHLNTPQIVELYQDVDGVANAAEGVAEALVTMSPDPDPRCFDGLEAMAERATEAVAVLSDVVARFVHTLCSPSDSVALADGIERIREFERTVDGLRNDVIAQAFDDAVERPLVYREFALLLDGLVDAMEDATDRIVLVSSTESWIVTETGGRR